RRCSKALILLNVPPCVGSRKGNNLKIIIKAKDDVQISRGIVQYRLQSYESWQTLIEEQNNSNVFSFSHKNDHDGITKTDCYEWKIPESIQNTNSAQVRIVLFDDQGLQSEKISEPFSIISNRLSGDVQLSKLNYQVGEKIHIDISVQADNALSEIEGFLFYDTKSHHILYDHDEKGLSDNLHYEISIPDNNLFASKNCYVVIHDAKDIVKNQINIKSDRFTIQIKSELPPPFNYAVNIYEESFDFPDNAQKTNESKEIKFVKIDDQNIAHIIVEHEYDYFQNTASDNQEDIFVRSENHYYLTYNPITGQKSSLIKVCDRKFSILDFIIFSEKPHVLLEKSGKNGIYYSFLDNGSFTSPSQKLNINSPDLKSLPELIQKKDLNFDSSRYAICDGYLWKLSTSDNDVIRYRFQDGIVGDKENIRMNNSVGSITTEYIKPVIDGKIIYYIDSSKNKLILQIKA
ncbi:hypothetical protein MHK_008201, partial [Candidatus Magnetomorum sp. HK-1]